MVLHGCWESRDEPERNTARRAFLPLWESLWLKRKTPDCANRIPGLVHDCEQNSGEQGSAIDVDIGAGQPQRPAISGTL
ncbi:hypothetical protein, partial [Prosthecobacter sp.]|uniref:hypothetical protein n=1 Tax=Prosthecobacter sp. TaxID=1965333 RepID=UPI00248A8BE2